MPPAGDFSGVNARLPIRDGDRSGCHPGAWRFAPGKPEGLGQTVQIRETRREAELQHDVFRRAVESDDFFHRSLRPGGDSFQVRAEISAIADGDLDQPGRVLGGGIRQQRQPFL